MMARITRRMAAGLLLAGLVAGPVLAQSSVTGLYRAEGRNPDGSTYSGSVRITQTGESIAMAWQVGTQAYSGTGIRQGRVITVDWGDSHPVVYVIMPDGTLHGTWANGRALERLTR